MINLLKWLRSINKITTQQYKTFRGQIINGDAIGCIRGLKHKGLITSAEAETLMLNYTE